MSDSPVSTEITFTCSSLASPNSRNTKAPGTSPLVESVVGSGRHRLRNSAAGDRCDGYQSVVVIRQAARAGGNDVRNGDVSDLVGHGLRRERGGRERVV